MSDSIFERDPRVTVVLPSGERIVLGTLDPTSNSPDVLELKRPSREEPYSAGGTHDA